MAGIFAVLDHDGARSNEADLLAAARAAPHRFGTSPRAERRGAFAWAIIDPTAALATEFSYHESGTDEGLVVVSGGAKGVDLEVLASSERKLTIEARDGKAADLDMSTRGGIGLRAVVDGRVGYASTEDLSEASLDWALTEAVDNAGLQTDGKTTLPAGRPLGRHDLFLMASSLGYWKDDAPERFLNDLPTLPTRLLELLEDRPESDQVEDDALWDGLVGRMRGLDDHEGWRSSTHLFRLWDSLRPMWLERGLDTVVEHCRLATLAVDHQAVAARGEADGIAIVLTLDHRMGHRDGGIAEADIGLSVPADAPGGASRFAIRPYPAALIETVEWRGRALTLRPIRPEDEAQHRAFLEQLDPVDIRMRIFYSRRSIQRGEVARLTQIDYEREMAFVVTAALPDDREETLGVVRATTDPDNDSAEFGIVVRSDIKGGGLGRMLMQKLIEYLRQRGTRRLVATVLRENHRMLEMVRELGFGYDAAQPDPELWSISLPLNETR